VPLQERASPHDTEAAACVQAPEPLQVPVLPQGGLAPHWPVGAVVPAAIEPHVPGMFPVVVRLQALQTPQLVLPAGRLQQKPSTQLPLMHWLAPVHAIPFAFSAQFRFGGEPWQVNGDRQCESIEQVFRQVSPPHT
jgi:hypothetical protein